MKMANNTESNTNASSGNGERLTFSITGHSTELIGQLYLTAKALKIAVASVFRHNLEMFSVLLDEERDKLTAREEKQVHDVAGALALSHICRLEGLPDKILLCDYLMRADKGNLCDAVNTASNIRLMLILDIARALAVNNETETKVSA
jgi:hypothetical protein